jgi:hypothetical protein
MRLELIRPDDLVNLEVETVNLHIKGAGGKKAPRLVVQDAKQPALLIVRFPPQAITETAYFEWSDVKAEVDGPPRPDPDAGATSSEALDPPGVAGERDATGAAAHASRLVFQLPANALRREPHPDAQSHFLVSASASPHAGHGPSAPRSRRRFSNSAWSKLATQATLRRSRGRWRALGGGPKAQARVPRSGRAHSLLERLGQWRRRERNFAPMLQHLCCHHCQR